jgi:hypothetical protein
LMELALSALPQLVGRLASDCRSMRSLAPGWACGLHFLRNIVAEYCLWFSSTAPCSSASFCLNLFLVCPHFWGMELLSIASGHPRPPPAARRLFASTFFWLAQISEAWSC